MTRLIASVGPLEAPLVSKYAQDRRLPLFEGPAEAGDFRDGAGRERRDHLGHECPAVFRAGVVDVAQLLVALPGERDFVVRSPAVSFASRCLFLGEVFGADLQGPADPVERISFPAAVSQGVLLDASAGLIDHGEPSITTWKASRTVMASVRCVKDVRQSVDFFGSLGGGVESTAVSLGHRGGWRQSVVVTVGSPAVVEDLDVAHDLTPGCLPRGEAVVMVELILQGRERRFRDGIVPAHPCLSHRLTDLVPPAPGPHFSGRVLGAAVAMEDRAAGVHGPWTSSAHRSSGRCAYGQPWPSRRSCECTGR